MSKIAIIYWSGTGNTEMMAKAVEEGALSQGLSAECMTCADFSANRMAEFDAFAFGCPSMGSEVLEESEFEPLFSECEAKLSGKKITLFGSYGWGDGEWMRNWQARCEEQGATLVVEPVICNETPDDSALEECKALGRAFASI